jgi:hypothetical protein
LPFGANTNDKQALELEASMFFYPDLGMEQVLATGLDFSLFYDELAIYREVEALEVQLREFELRSESDMRSESCLKLKLRKAHLYIQLRNRRTAELQASPRDRAIIELELQEVNVHLELRLVQHEGQSEMLDLDEDEEYLALKLRKVRLKKELAEYSQISRLAPPSTPTALESILLQSSGSEPNGSINSYNPVQNAEPRLRDARQSGDSSISSLPMGTETKSISNANIAKLVRFSTLKHPLVPFVPEEMQSVLAIEKEAARSSKRPRLSDEQKANRKLVIERGGQCLNCKFNLSKVQLISLSVNLPLTKTQPRCDGGAICSNCQTRGFECIRSNFKDNNIFSYGTRFPFALGKSFLG